MPIYDFDGSTSREIGKLYDNNGTTSSQIKEVYDNDGPASRLVYKDAPDYLFNWGDNREITGGWSTKKYVLSGNSGTNTMVGADFLDPWLGSTGTSTRRIYIHTNKAVNVTDLKTINMYYEGSHTVTCADTNVSWWGIEHFGIALSSIVPTNDSLATNFNYTSYSSWWNRAPNVGGPGSFTWGPITRTIDTSGISGNFYVVVVLDAYDAVCSSGFTIRRITCTS